MATLIPFPCFATDFADGQHLLEVDVLKMALSAGEYDPEEEEYKPLPLNKTNWNSTDFPELFGSLSYPDGGYVLEKTKYIESEGVYKVFLKNLDFPCPEGQFFGPFRYLIVYNHTVNDRLIGYYDYTAVVELNSGESFFVDFDPDQIVPAIMVDTIGNSVPTPTPSPAPSPSPSPTPTPGISFLSQTGTGDYAGTHTGTGLENTNILKVTMFSDGTTKYMDFISGSNGILYYKYQVFDPNKTGATASMSINGYQQGPANRKSGIVHCSVNAESNQRVVFSFNSGKIPDGGTSAASAEFEAYIHVPNEII
jgi:hypothetical protein